MEEELPWRWVEKKENEFILIENMLTFICYFLQIDVGTAEERVKKGEEEAIEEAIEEAKRLAAADAADADADAATATATAATAAAAAATAAAAAAAADDDDDDDATPTVNSTTSRQKHPQIIRWTL